MERLPGAALLVLREGDVVVGVAVALRTHEGDARLRAALQVLREQAIGPPDGRVGVIVGAHRADAPVHADLLADRTVDHDHGGGRARGRAARRHLGSRERQNDREVFRLGAGHDGVHRHLLDRVFPGGAELGRLHAADDLVRLAASVREHRAHALLRRRDDRQPVGPVVVEKELLQALFGVRLDEPRRRALECGHAQPFSTVVRPAITSCITGTPVTGSLPWT